MPPPVLHVHPASRADALAARLSDLLAQAPADAFAREVVAVPTRGVERWLTQTLATRLGTTAHDPQRHDGVVANVAFPSPREVVDGAIAAALGLDPETDPWTRGRTVWPLLATVDAHLDEPWLAILREHLRDATTGVGAGAAGPATTDGDDDPAPRRLVAVRHLAGLYDRYALHRPQILRAWTAGDDVDGAGRALPPEAAWQAELFRRLCARIDRSDPAARLDDATAAITNDATARELDLPPRISLFGLTRLPPAHVAILRALATHREVHLFLLHPSPALWTTVATALGDTTAPTRLRADDLTADLPRNRLLGSWGRDARELQVVLHDAGATATSDAERHDENPDDATTHPSLLQRLQRDVRADTAPPGAPRTPDAPDDRPLLDPTDRSVVLHACHGRARQVEVLRDAILHALREDPTLEPRDVIVMCPDIEQFAPLIHATFGTAGPAPEDASDPDDATADDPTDVPDLRVRLADRALRQTNPVLGTIGRLLELATERMTASQVVDLLDRAPVRRRFALDDDDLARIEDWIARTHTRWGLDADHRAPYALQRVTANTWRAGLDRILLGATMTEDDDRLVTGVLPLDDVESGAIDLAGRLAEIVDRLDAVVTRFATRRTLAGWTGELAHAADLLTATAPTDAWQRSALDRLLDDIATSAEDHDSLLDVTEVRALLDDHLAGRPTRANFRTGHLTVCTLQPMRSIPHRVVCLLGLDDDCFPRRSPRDGDDLITQAPHVGDHEGRGEDRQMLLDALLAAGDRLIVTTTGNDERTNAPKPPAVPVGELLDQIDRTVRTAPDDGRPAREQITVRHPLQPFDPRNFTPGHLVDATPFSFDRASLDGARAAARADRTPPPRFLGAPLPPLDDRGVVELDDLVRFVEHPARAFLRRRLGIGAGDRDDELADGLPIDIDALEQWSIADRMLRARRRGRTFEEALAAEAARGALPPGALAQPVIGRLRHSVEHVAATADAQLGPAGERSSVDVRVDLPGGRVLGGTVAGLEGDRLTAVIASRLGPKHRLAQWVRLLALAASHPGRAFSATTVARARFGSGQATVSIAHLDPVDPGIARAHLAVLVDLMLRGMTRPAPLVCATSAAYAQAVYRGHQPIKPATSAWTSTFKFPREDKDPEHVLLFGGVLPFEKLVASGPLPDEQGEGWDPDQPSRLGRWALRLWTPLLDHEQIRDIGG